MKNVILVSILAVVLAVGVGAAYAAPPVNGTYKSSLGHFDEGREGSSWPGANGFLSPGNVLHAESWDGSALGGDWRIMCPTVVDTLLIFSTVSAGTGHMAYLITYTGGYIELNGSWAGPDATYTGIIDNYYESRSMQFVGGVMVGSVSDHSVDAHIVGYPAKCVAFGIGNGVWLGSGAQPSGYPNYRDATCAAGPTNGHWGDIRDLTLTVQGCEVSTERATWGAVKALYKN